MAQTTSPNPPAGARRPASILVIDGNEEHQILSVTALGRSGHRVAVADTGREGIRLARSKPFDVIVVAFKLRDAHGLEVLRTLHEQLPDVPLIFVVSEGAEEHAVRALSSGASGYLVKTPRYNELLPSVVDEQIAKVQFRARLRDQERALVDAESRFEEFLKTSREPVFVIDPAGTFLAVNDAMCAMTAYSRDSLMQKNLFDLVVMGSAGTSPKLADLARVGFEGVLDFEMRRSDGVELFVEIVPKLVRRDGEVVGIEALARDVTQRKKVEHQLRDIYGWLHAIYEASNDAVVIADADSRLIEWNARALELFERDPQTLANTTMAGLLRELARRTRDPNGILVEMDEYGTNPEAVVEGNIEVVSPQPRIYWRMTAPVHSFQGERIGRLWTFRDITERRRAELAAREGEAGFRAVFNNVLDGVLIADDTAHLVDANPAACELLGLPRDRILSMRIPELSAPQAREGAESTWRDLLRTGWRRGILQITRPDGQVRDVEFAARARFLPGLHVSVLRDITDRRRAEEAVRRRDAILGAVGFASSQFLSTADFEDSVQLVLARLGEAAAASRALLFSKRSFPDGRSEGFLRYEWCAPGIRSLFSDMDAEPASLAEETFGRWANVLDGGGVVAGPASTFPPAERSALEKEDVRSVIAMPIRVGSDLWGFLNLDDCVVEREWSQPEQEALRAAAGSISAAIERQRAEVALRASEGRYRLLFEANPLPMWVFDRESLRFLAVNEAAIAHYGYSRAEFLSMTIKDIRPEAEVAALMENVARGSSALTNRGVWNHRLKDGSLIEVEITAHDIDFDGRDARLVLANDVTDRRRAEAEIANSERKFRMIFETAADAIVLIDGRGTILDMNPAAEGVIERPRAEMIGHALAEYLSADDVPRSEEYLRAILKDLPTREPFEVSIPQPSGGRRFLEVRSRVLQEEGRRPLVEIVARDITDRMEMNRRLLESERQASLGRMSAYVAHEINTPLTNISLLTASIARRVKDDDVQAKLAKINAQRRLAANIISDLLHFHRRRDVTRVATDLREVLARAVDHVEPYRKESVTLVAESVGPEVRIEADPEQLDEVFVNLIRNAFDATSAGSISVRLEERPDEIAVVIADTGTGMSRDVLDRLFEPFFTTKRIGEGTGLGLAMCKSIVTSHGGRIDVTSEPGNGSSFTVTLPRRATA